MMATYFECGDCHSLVDKHDAGPGGILQCQACQADNVVPAEGTGRGRVIEPWPVGNIYAPIIGEEKSNL